MKTVLFFNRILLLNILFIDSYAQTESESATNNADSASFCISLDVLPLFTGAIVSGIEGRLDDHFSVGGTVGFGKILFTDIKSMYSVGIRYYTRTEFVEGLFIGFLWSRVALSTNLQSADVGNIGIECGYRWQMLDEISFDVLGGIYINDQPKTEFKEISGNVTKTITLGGGPSGGINVKLVFLL